MKTKRVGRSRSSKSGLACPDYPESPKVVEHERKCLGKKERLLLKSGVGDDWVEGGAGGGGGDDDDGETDILFIEEGAEFTQPLGRLAITENILTHTT